MENTTNQPKYLVAEEDRYNAIINDTLDKFQFEHQEASEVDAFKNGIFENRIDINPFGIPVYLSLQDNDGAGLYIRQNSSLIETAAREFQINSDFLKAVIYTEMSRGWYDDYNPFGSPTVLPGNLNKKWEALIPGSDVNNKNDNIRLTAKLLSEIAERLDYPYPEDIYSLYNGLGHDRTYENKKTKSTPYFMKEVLDAKAWEKDIWHLPNKPGLPSLNNSDNCFPPGTLIEMWPLGDDARIEADGCYDESVVLGGVWKKPIEEIGVGDVVLSHDGEGRLCPGVVDKTFTNTSGEFLHLSFDDGRGDLYVTPGHHFLTETGDFMAIDAMVRLSGAARGGRVRLVDADGSIVTARARSIMYSSETAHLFACSQEQATIYCDGHLARTLPARKIFWPNIPI